MAKPTKYATLICFILTIIAIIGIIIGLSKSNPLIIITALLPTVIYEVYRTEGESTKIAAWFLLITIVAELIFIIFKINYNLAAFLGTEQKYLVGYQLPLGDIKVLAPMLLAVTSTVLFIRTYGVYTKWLAVIIFVASFAVVYCLDPVAFKALLQAAVNRIFSYFNYLL